MYESNLRHVLRRSSPLHGELPGEWGQRHRRMVVVDELS